MLHPIDYRLAKNKFWLSTWNSYSLKNYRNLILNDKILNVLGKIFSNCFKITVSVAAPWANFRKFRKYSQFVIGFDGRRAIRLGPNKIKKLPNFIIPEDYNIIRFSNFSILKVFFLIDQNLTNWIYRQKQWRTPLRYFNLRYSSQKKNKTSPFFWKNLFISSLEKKNFKSTNYFLYLINLLKNKQIRYMIYFNNVDIDYFYKHIFKKDKKSIYFHFFHNNFKLLNKIRNNYFLFYTKFFLFSSNFINKIKTNELTKTKKHSLIRKIFTNCKNITINNTKNLIKSDKNISSTTAIPKKKSNFNYFITYNYSAIKKNLSFKKKITLKKKINNFFNFNLLQNNKLLIDNNTINKFNKKKLKKKIFNLKLIKKNYFNHNYFLNFKKARIINKTYNINNGSSFYLNIIKNYYQKKKNLFLLNYFLPKNNSNINLKNFNKQKLLLKKFKKWRKLKFFLEFSNAWLKKLTFSKPLKFSNKKLIKINKNKNFFSKKKKIIRGKNFFSKKKKIIRGKNFFSKKKKIIRGKNFFSKKKKIIRGKNFFSKKKKIIKDKILFSNLFLQKKYCFFKKKLLKKWKKPYFFKNKVFKYFKNFYKLPKFKSLKKINFFFKKKFRTRIYYYTNNFYIWKKKTKKYLNFLKRFKNKKRKHIPYKIFLTLSENQKIKLKKKYFLIFKKPKLYINAKKFNKLSRNKKKKIYNKKFVIFKSKFPYRLWWTHKKLKNQILKKSNTFLWSKTKFFNKLNKLKLNYFIINIFLKKKSFFWKNKHRLIKKKKILKTLFNYYGYNFNKLYKNLKILYKTSKIKPHTIGYGFFKNLINKKKYSTYKKKFFKNPKLLLKSNFLFNKNFFFRFFFNPVYYNYKSNWSLISKNLKFLKTIKSNSLFFKKFNNFKPIKKISKKKNLIFTFKILNNTYLLNYKKISKKKKMIRLRGGLLKKNIYIYFWKKKYLLNNNYKKFIIKKKNYFFYNFRESLIKKFKFKNNNKVTLIKSDSFNTINYKFKFLENTYKKFFISKFLFFNKSLLLSKKIKLLLKTNSPLIDFFRFQKKSLNMFSINNINVSNKHFYNKKYNFYNSFFFNYLKYFSIKFFDNNNKFKNKNLNSKKNNLLNQNKIFSNIKVVTTNRVNLKLFLNLKSKSKFSKFFQRSDIYSWWDIWWTDKVINDWKAYSLAPNERFIRFRPYSIRSVSKIQRYNFYKTNALDMMKVLLPLPAVLEYYKKFALKKKILNKFLGKPKAQLRWKRDMLKFRTHLLKSFIQKNNKISNFLLIKKSIKIFNEYFNFLKTEHRKVQETVNPLIEFKKWLKIFVTKTLVKRYNLLLSKNYSLKKLQFKYFTYDEKKLKKKI